jgi:hypothetical protein
MYNPWTGDCIESTVEQNHSELSDEHNGRMLDVAAHSELQVPPERARFLRQNDISQCVA